MSVKKKVVEIDTQEAQTSVKDLRQLLKTLKDTMLSTAEGTEEYNKALSLAAEITKQLKDQTEFIANSAMDFGLVVGNVNGALGGMIGGLQAAKATMNLFGVENEDVIKSLLQMQNLMAISQALPALDKGIKSFKRLGIAIKASTAGLNGFKKALLSTGIGAAVVAVGMLAANWDKLTEAINKSINASDIAAQSLIDKVKIAVNALKTMLSDLNKMSDSTLENLRQLSWQDLTDAINKTNFGVAADDLVKLFSRYNKALKNGNVELARETKATLDLILSGNEQVKTAFENFIKTSEEAHNREKKAAEDSAKAQAEASKKALDELQKFKDAYTNLIQEINDYGLSDREKAVSKLDETEKAKLAIVQDMLKKRLISEEEAAQRETQITEHFEEERKKLREKYRQDDRNQSITSMEVTYQLQIAQLLKNLDEELLTKEEYNKLKSDLDKQYVEDYIATLQYMLDTEKNLTDTLILDLTNKINDARALLQTESETSNSGLTGDEISKAINASALALNDFSGNPAWGKVLQNISLIAANWDKMTEQMKGSWDQSFAAIAQIAATGLGAVAAMLNGLAAEQDSTSKEGFESLKKFQVAGATMSMLAGIASAWASSMQLGPIAGPILGAILSAMMTGIGIAQIAKIKKTQFNSGSSTGGSSTPSTGAVTTLNAPVQYTQDVQGANIEDSIKDSRVYVVESDITNTQEKVSVAESEARF